MARCGSAAACGGRPRCQSLSSCSPKKKVIKEERRPGAPPHLASSCGDPALLARPGGRVTRAPSPLLQTYQALITCDVAMATTARPSSTETSGPVCDCSASLRGPKFKGTSREPRDRSSFRLHPSGAAALVTRHSSLGLSPFRLSPFAFRIRCFAPSLLSPLPSRLWSFAPLSPLASPLS